MIQRKIRNGREDRKLTQQEMANHLGITRLSYSNKELGKPYKNAKGNNKFKDTELEKILELYNKFVGHKEIKSINNLK